MPMVEQLALPRIEDVRLKSHPSRSGGHTADLLSQLHSARPNNPRPLCDNRLRDISLASWIEVPFSDVYASNLISRYLTTDHPVLGFFDADLFVKDLIDKRARFCSPLLVSAVLFWACVSVRLSTFRTELTRDEQSYTSVDSNAPYWGQILLDIAKQQWSADQDKPSILTVAAGYILGVAFACLGDDELGVEFQDRSTFIARQLRLLNVSKSAEEIAAEKTMSPEDYQAAAHVAWSAHNWLALMSQYYGAVPPSYCPTFRIPGDSSNLDNGVPVPPLPVYMGKTFTAMCKLRCIHTKFIRAHNDSGQSLEISDTSLEFAEGIFREMLTWADELEHAQQRIEFAEDHVLTLQ